MVSVTRLKYFIFVCIFWQDKLKSYENSMALNKKVTSESNAAVPGIAPQVSFPPSSSCLCEQVSVWYIAVWHRMSRKLLFLLSNLQVLKSDQRESIFKGHGILILRSKFEKNQKFIKYPYLTTSSPLPYQKKTNFPPLSLVLRTVDGVSINIWSIWYFVWFFRTDQFCSFWRTSWSKIKNLMPHSKSPTPAPAPKKFFFLCYLTFEVQLIGRRRCLIWSSDGGQMKIWRYIRN